MILHARRAVPWALVCISASLIVLMMAIVGQWPWVAWPLQGISVGLLAATAALCMDEPTPELTGTTPRPLKWRATSAGLGVLALTLTWLVGVFTVGGDLFGHRTDVLGQGIGATAAAVGAALWLRSRGTPAPGRSLSIWIVAATAGLSLIRPLEQALPLLPYGPTGPWENSRLLWTGTTLLGLVAVACATADLGWRQRNQPALPTRSLTEHG